MYAEMARATKNAVKAEMAQNALNATQAEFATKAKFVNFRDEECNNGNVGVEDEEDEEDFEDDYDQKRSGAGGFDLETHVYIFVKC